MHAECHPIDKELMGQHEPGATTSADMVTSARRLVDNLHPDELEIELSNGVVSLTSGRRRAAVARVDTDLHLGGARDARVLGGSYKLG